MGVSGSGKSTIASHLADRTGWPMVEGDDHHSASNRDKIARGEPLSDEDRAPWVDALANAVNAVERGPVVLACSALTSYVRDRLTQQSKRPCRWFLLTASPEELMQRMETRTGHFMPASLLASQLAALDAPSEAVQIDATLARDAICDAILAQLG
jgi:gluconokinase